ncbi:hypothetical protein PD653B2_2993, partial [Nocardioides sp. PD653-B2]
ATPTTSSATTRAVPPAPATSPRSAATTTGTRPTAAGPTNAPHPGPSTGPAPWGTSTSTTSPTHDIP